MHLRHWTVRTRLLAGFGALLILMGGIGAAAASRLSSLRSSMAYVTSTVTTRVSAANALTDAVNEAARYKLAMFSVTSPELIEQFGKNVAIARENINAAYARLDTLAADSLHVDSLLQAQVASVKTLRKVHAAAFDSAMALRKAGQLPASEALLTSAVLPSLRDYVAGIDSLVATQESHLQAESATANARADRGMLLIALSVTIAVIFGLGLGWLIYRSITVPLIALTKAADQLAAGDCDVQLGNDDARDEVAELAAAMHRMADAEADLATTARQLSAGDVSTIVTVRGERDVLGQAMQRLQSTLVSLEAETGTLSAAAREGHLAVRAPAARFDGAFRQLVDGMNNTIDHLLAPVHEARTTLERLASRDLSARMSTTWAGEHAVLAEALNTAAGALDTTLSEVLAASEQVNGAASQIADGSQGLAASSSEQAASLEEVSAGLQELGGVTRQNVAHATEAQSLAGRARESSTRGVEAMHRLSDSIARIKEASDSTARIIKTIDEIAFQTNLLALNAAVEAARAGDAGRGFAVVAEEVRSLAIRSAAAAKKTTDLIDQAVSVANEGVVLNDAVLSQLTEIDLHVARVGEVMGDVTIGSTQQRDGITQIGAAIEQMNGVTQAVAATAEESASASEELAGQAATLTALVNEFTLTDGISGTRSDRGGDRTHDLRIKSPLLYRLSYPVKCLL